MKGYIDENLKALVILDSLEFLSYRQKRMILSFFEEEPQKLFSRCGQIHDYLTEIKKEEKIKLFDYAFSKEYFEHLEKDYGNISVVSYLDAIYPDRLRELEDYPILLYTVGNLELLNSKSTFSVVGSRKTLAEVMEFCKLVVDSCNDSVTLVCGNSEGVDKVSLEYGKNVICVLPCGMKFISPESTLNLVRKVAKNGLVITEYPPSYFLKKYSYLQRNRLIAALSDGVLVASGTRESGVKSLAEFALDYGKEIFALPYGVWDNGGQLCNDLIKNGANLCNELSDLNYYLNLKESKKQNKLTENGQLVYNLISDGIKCVDKIIEESKLAPETVMATLTLLQMDGFVIDAGAGEFTAINNH